MSTTTLDQPLATQPRPTMLVSRSGLKLTTLDDVWRFAQCLAKSGLAPKGIQTPEAITIAVQMGMELGLPPMASLQNIAVINGRPSVYGDAQLAVVRGTGELESFEEWYESGGKRIPRNPTEYKDDTTAVCRLKRQGSEPQESGYSVADAKRANLWGKTGPWTETPFRMLRFRARSFALRDAFGDALRGLMTAEEAQELPPKEVTGRVVESAKPALFGPAVAPFPLDNSPSADQTATAANPPQGEAPTGGVVGAAETTSAGTSPNADAHVETVGVDVSPAVASPKPPKRTPKPTGEPLVLDAENETCKERLKRRIAQAGLDPAKVSDWLATQLIPPVGEMAENEAQDCLAAFAEIQKFATV